MAEGVVVARQLTKRYGEQVAVDGLDLHIPEGTVLGCIGPSGSGKSTTVRMLTGIVRPTSGDAFVFGVPPVDLSAADRARIGYMPQLNVLYPHLSIGENLDFAASLYGVPAAQRHRRSQEALEFVELAGDRGKLLRQASGGMQRRLALAASLVHEPELLFLDEPTAGIDPVLRRRFWDHFAELKERGRTLLVTTQYVGEAAYCDRVAVLSDSRLLIVDTPEGLRRRAFGGEMVDLVSEDPLPDDIVAEVPAGGVERVGTEGREIRAVVEDAGEAIPVLQSWFTEHGVRLRSIEQHHPPFDDVFFALVKGGREDDDRA